MRAWGHRVGLVKDHELVAAGGECDLLLRKRLDPVPDDVDAPAPVECQDPSLGRHSLRARSPLVRRVKLEHTLLVVLPQQSMRQCEDARRLSDARRALQPSTRVSLTRPSLLRTDGPR